MSTVRKVKPITSKKTTETIVEPNGSKIATVKKVIPNVRENNPFSTSLPAGVQGPVQSDKVVRDFVAQVPAEEQPAFFEALQRKYPTAWDNVKSLGGELVTGLSNANDALWRFADLVTLDEWASKVTGTENKTGQFFDQMYAANDAYNQQQAERRAHADKWAAKLGEYVVQPVAQAIPNAVVASMTGGASLGASAGSALGSAAMTSATGSIGSMVASSAKELLKNPSFWVSFAQTAGPTYFDAKENGAGEVEAVATAILNGFAGSAIEVGGGIEKLPSTPMGVKQWVKSALEEGGEEVLQGITEGLVHTAVYDADREWVSLTDPDAIFSGSRAVQEFAGGVVVGGVLGGGQIGVAKAAESIKNYAGFIKIGNSYLRAENGQTIEDAIRIGLSNAKGTEWYRAAEVIQQKEADAERISPYVVGRMVVGSYTPAARMARAVDTQVRQSAQTYNVDEQTADAVARVAVATGRQIEFVSPEQLQVQGANGVSTAEGRYVNGKVLLNASMSAERLTGYLLTHELTHSIEGTRQWSQLEQIVRSYYGDAGFESAVQEVTARYARNNTTLTPEGAAREVVAQWVGNNLYRQGFAQAIVDGDATVGNVFLQILDKMRLALGGTKNSRTASNIALVERLFMRALENVSNIFDTKSGYSVEYQNADENEEILQLVERVKKGEHKDNDSVSLGIVDEKTALRIQEITGIDVRGWKVEIEARQISHILKDHGTNGLTDHSMSSDNDIAKIDYVVKNTEEISDGGSTSAYFNFVNGKNRHARTILYQKSIGDRYYYVVEAVPQTKKKTLQIVSAFINKDKKIEGSNLIDAKSPDATSNDVGMTPSTDTNIPQNGTGVNSYSMQNGGENSQFSFGEGDAQDLTTPVRSVTGNELAAEEAERFSTDADDIALGHFSETTPPSRQSRDTSPDKGRQGDAANSQALGNLDNVVDLSFDNELAQRVAGVHGSAKYTIIQNYVLEVLGEQPITLSDGKQVIVDKSDARHVAKLSGDKKTAHISKIKELVESATLYAEDTQVEHNKFDYFCYYRANVRLNGEVFSIYLNVGRGINDGRYHLYDITQKIRDTANRIDGFERPKPNEGYALENGVSIDSIRNSAENVKGNSSLDDIPDAEDAMAEVEEKVSDSKKRKFTKAQEEHSRRRDALLEEYEAGAISKEEYKAALDELEQDAIRDNDKKWSTGKRGSAAEKQHAKNAVETYSSDANTRLARREERVETAEQRAREKRMAKKCTEIRRSIHTTVDELAAKLARPSKNRFIPADLVEGIQNLLQLFEETPESIDNRVFELKKKIADTSDEGKKARLQKRLENLQNRNRLARENIQKIKIAYGRFCGEVSYGGEQHKFAVHKIKEELDALSDALFDTELDGMSYEELRNVFNIVRGVAFQVNNAQKLFCKEHRGELQEQGEAQIDEALEAEAFYGKTLLKYDFVKKLVNWQLTPDRFFKMLGGFKKDSVWERTYNSFKEGQKRYFAILREFDEYFKSITDHAEFKRLASTNPNDLVDIGLKDTDGKPILLTRGMMLSMYMQLTCNMEQVIWSGLEIPEFKTYYEYGITKDAYKKGTRISAKDFNQKLWELTEQMKTAQTPEDQSRIQEQITETVLLAQQDFNGMLEKIRGKLTEFESDFIEKAETWFNEISKNHINETTTQIFGYPKAMVERYFRIRRDTDFVETEMAGLAYNQTIESMGSLQARVKSKSPMLLTDLMDELTANCNDVARIVGFMAPETDFRRLYNVRKDMDHSVKEVLRRFGSELGHVGVSANQYVENLLADLTFGRKFEQGPLGWLYRNSVRAVMTLNPRVAMIQLAAWPTAAAELGWKTLGTSAKSLFKKPPIDLINKYSIYGYMRNRGDGGMQEFSAARQGHGVVDKLYNWVDDKTDGKVLGWCQKVDQGVVNSLWFACEEEIRRTRPKLKEGSEDFYKAVGELLDEVIIKTQSNGTTLEKPDLLRNKGAVMKILTSFKTDSMQQFNILFEGEMTHRRYVADFKAGKNGVTADDIAAAKRKKANAITSVVVGGVFCATILRMLANFLLQNTDKYRDEDGELTASSVTLAATSEMMGSMAGLVTFGDYIYEVVEAKLFGQRYYGISDMGLETLSDVLNTVATGDLSQGKTWGKLALNVSDALGIPANNVKKMFEAVAAHAEDIKNGEFLSMNGGYDTSASQYYSRLYKALQSDNEERAERIRRTLKGMEKTDAEIMAGLRAAIKKSDKQFKSIFDEMFADIRVTDLYKKLTEKEQKRVQSGIAGYVADTILADVTDGEMSDTNKKAARYAKKGVPEGDYFLAQVVKNAFFADTNKDEEVSRTEYAAALEDGGYSETVRRMLLGLK